MSAARADPILPPTWSAPAAWRDAQFIPLRADDPTDRNEGKRPARRWLGQPRLPFEALVVHVAAGGNLGVQPATVGVPVAAERRVPLAVLDLDRGDPAPLLRDFPALATADTARPGGLHVWYQDPHGPRDGGKWAYGDAAGEVISLTGSPQYARAYPGELPGVDAHLAALLATLKRAGEYSDRWRALPHHLIREGGILTGEDAPARVRLVEADKARALALLVEALNTARPRSRPVEVGCRHDTLRAALWRRGGARTFNGSPVDARHMARLAARIYLAMQQPATHRYPVEAAAVQLAWTLFMLPVWQARSAAGNHKAHFLERQSMLGRRGAAARRGSANIGPLLRSASNEASNETARPWTAAGVSRATWYRQRRAAAAGRLFEVGNSAE